jgi:general secretion pathway protein G
VPLEPWGKPYLKVAGREADFDLVSHGKDGATGGSGESADITNY